MLRTSLFASVRGSPSGVSRSIASASPSLPGFRYPRNTLRSSNNTTTFLCVEAEARVFTEEGPGRRPCGLPNSMLCYAVRNCQVVIYQRFRLGFRLGLRLGASIFCHKSYPLQTEYSQL